MNAVHVLSVGVTPVVRVSRLGRTTFHVGGGIGLVSRSGDAFYWYRGTTSFVGEIVRAGAGVKVGWGPFEALRLDAEYYVYHSYFHPCERAEGAFCYPLNLLSGSRDELQRDLVWSFGLAFRVAGKSS